jgi:hypothetical protein
VLAQPLGEKRLYPTQAAYFDQDEPEAKVRVDQLSVEFRPDEAAILGFRATSLDQACTEPSHSEVVLVLLGNKGHILATHNVVKLIVAEGDSVQHRMPIAGLTSEVFSQAKAFRVDLTPRSQCR